MYVFVVGVVCCFLFLFVLLSILLVVIVLSLSRFVLSFAICWPLFIDQVSWS